MLTRAPWRTSSVPRRNTISPVASAPTTSARSPWAGPLLTSTHSAAPSFTRITNTRSLVLTTLVNGTRSAFWLPCTGHLTDGYMPAASRPLGFATSSSTGMDLVLGSIDRAIRLTVPLKVSVGYAGTENGTLTPLGMAPTSDSGTGTTSLNRLSVSSWNIGSELTP